MRPEKLDGKAPPDGGLKGGEPTKPTGSWAKASSKVSGASAQPLDKPHSKGSPDQKVTDHKNLPGDRPSEHERPGSAPPAFQELGHAPESSLSSTNLFAFPTGGLGLNFVDGQAQGTTQGHPLPQQFTSMTLDMPDHNPEMAGMGSVLSQSPSHALGSQFMKMAIESSADNGDIQSAGMDNVSSQSGRRRGGGGTSYRGRGGGHQMPDYDYYAGSGTDGFGAGAMPPYGSGRLPGQGMDSRGGGAGMGSSLKSQQMQMPQMGYGMSPMMGPDPYAMGMGGMAGADAAMAHHMASQSYMMGHYGQNPAMGGSPGMSMYPPQSMSSGYSPSQQSQHSAMGVDGMGLPPPMHNMHQGGGYPMSMYPGAMMPMGGGYPSGYWPEHPMYSPGMYGANGYPPPRGYGAGRGRSAAPRYGGSPYYGGMERAPMYQNGGGGGSVRNGDDGSRRGEVSRRKKGRGGGPSGLAPDRSADLLAARERISLEQIRGHLLGMCKDQVGCRLLQHKLDDTQEDSVAFIFKEAKPHLAEMMVDPFGNYLFQKMFDKINDQQRGEILDLVSPWLVEAGCNLHGTRSVQKIIECSSSPELRAKITKALSAATVELCTDSNGNHIIQRALLKLQPQDNQFVYDAVVASCVKVATHRHGCCVVQRSLDAATPEQRAALIAEVAVHALALMQDPYGNYVAQYVLDGSSPEESAGVVRAALGQVAMLSQQKFSSNVIERCLDKASPEVQALYMEELGNRSTIQQLLLDQYANYVIQKALTIGPEPAAKQLVVAIKAQLPGLGMRNTSGGRRIAAKIVKRFPEMDLGEDIFALAIASHDRGGSRR